MTALLRVELTRLRWRRGILLLLLAAFVVPAVLVAGRVFETRPVSEADLAQARQDAAGEIARCEERPRQFGLTRETADQCADTIVAWFSQRAPLVLGQELDTMVGTATLLVVLMIVLGTVFVGHDWGSGSMSNQLLFEPRRSRIWVAKAVVVALVALVVTLVVLTLCWLALWLVADLRDLPAGREVVVDGLLVALRAALVAAGAAAGGLALTMLFRSTVATLGLLFVTTLATGLLLGALGLDGRWQPQTNLVAALRGGTTYFVEVPEACYATMGSPDGPAPGCEDQRRLSGTQGGGYLGTLLLLAGTASVLSFRRRDVP